MGLYARIATARRGAKMAETYDAVIIGAGHNGLVCGAYLAKAGLKVCILERRHVVGGATVSEELWPGYTVSVASYVMSVLSPRVIADLELKRHGFEVIPAGRLYRIADLLTQSVYDYLARWFESDEVLALLSYYASIGTFAGPRSPGTAYVLLHHLMGEHGGAGGWGFMRGGMGSISRAIAAAARGHGAGGRTRAEIERVVVEGGRATGVALKSGEVVAGKVIASNADAKTTFLRLVAEKELPADFLADLRSYRTFSTALKINLAVHEPPPFTAFKADEIGARYPTYVHIGPSVDYLERAYDDAKYGTYSARPFVTPVVPSMVDDTIAPKGKHIVNLFGGHAPYALKGMTWAAEKDRFFDTVIDTVA